MPPDLPIIELLGIMSLLWRYVLALNPATRRRHLLRTSALLLSRAVGMLEMILGVGDCCPILAETDVALDKKPENL
jgi:hypothetical protein